MFETIEKHNTIKINHTTDKIDLKISSKTANRFDNQLATDFFILFGCDFIQISKPRERERYFSYQ